jgi:hypothetical protein
VLLLALGAVWGLKSTSDALAQAPPQQLAFNFIVYEMMNSQGGIFTQYRDFPTTDENEAKGHEVLLRNGALLLRYALREGDRELFDLQAHTIEEHFLDEGTRLLHWKLGRSMEPVLNSWGAYSNDPGASLEVVSALLDGFARWGDPDDQDLARRIVGGLTRNVGPDRTLRYYASWKPDGESAGIGDRVVLSQLDFITLAELAAGSAFWASVLEVNLELALSGQTGVGLFHFSFRPQGGGYDPENGSLLSMAETAYHLAEFGGRYDHPEAVEAARRFLSFVERQYARQGALVGRYDPQTGTPLVAWENVAAYAQLARLAQELDEPSFADTLILEQLLPLQARDWTSPVFGAFTPREDDAFAFDTLSTLFALPPLPDIPVQQHQQEIRAVWYLGFERDSYLRPHVIDDLRQIQARLCPTHIGLFAVVYQDDRTSSDPHRDPERTASDAALRQVIAQIHRLGMGVVLLTPLFPDDGSWEGIIQPDDLDAWFESWREILIHYADLAQETGVEVLLIGSELVSLRGETERWRELIDAVRARYRGMLSYAVNFWANRQEYEEVREMPWEGLDALGVTAYFELTNKMDPTVQELEAAWRHDRNGQDVLADLEALHSKWGKPIVFWEMGYESKDGTNSYPWDFPRPGAVDEGEQADAWGAFLNVIQGIWWFTGYGIYAETVSPIPNPRGYSVLGKQAEHVLGQQCQP